MSLQVVFSNRIEVLAKHLQDELARVPADPFEAQHVVVPTTAISRYLQLAIARRRGICANVGFSYLARWLWQLAKVMDAGVPERSPVDPGTMTWLILRILAEERFAEYSRIGSFMKKADDMMRYELARAVAHVFDQYATYRCDWLELWREGKKIPDFRGRSEADEDWQSELWRAVARDLGLSSIHPLQAALDKVKKKDHAGFCAKLPSSAAVFTVPAIPPLYLKTICQLSNVMNITLYMMNPCREYWFDIVPPKRLAYLQSMKRDAYREVGHSLLADWGQATQSAIDLVYEEVSDAQTSDRSEFIDPAGDTLIARLQKSILDMEDLTPGSLRISASDRSMEIHCCYGTVRELEVLHDRLLDLFAADETLLPDDVVVLTPDMDTLAPAVDAVFGTVSTAHRIPYVVAGQAMESTNPCLRVLIDLLDLISSRMPASRVFDFLRQPPVARRFKLDESGLALVREWLNRAGIHWGIDRRHRADLGCPREDRHTFHRGLDSLMLSIALPHLDEPLAGLLPAGNLEGSRAETLGHFWLFTERLAFWKDQLQYPRPADQWQKILNGMLADFASADVRLQVEYDKVTGAIAELADNWRAAKLDQQVSARVVRTALLDADVSRRGAVPSGMVTFASLAAMRGLSYRVVCLVGMNDNDYPAREQPVEFDLIPRGKPRRGDRQRRREERGIFLDAILAAREVLHISYTGRDQRSNAEMPPSVLVAELLDYLAGATAPDLPNPEELQAARTRLMVKHPLQPFSRRYFDNSDVRLSSHVSQYADALNKRVAPPVLKAVITGEDAREDENIPQTAVPFFNGMPTPQETPATELSVIQIDDLAAFLNNPSKFFLQRQLKIALPQPQDLIVDEEPLIMDFSGERNLAGRIMDSCLAHKRMLTLEEALAIIRALPESPPGAACEAGLKKIWHKLSGLAERLLAATAENKLPPMKATIMLTEHERPQQITANFGDLRPCGLVRFRCDELRGYDHLRAWIDHLVLCASLPDGVRLQTRHFAFDGDLTFGEISTEHAGKYLAALISLYGKGLLQPVPFFKKAAWGYVEKGIDEARRRWFGGHYAQSQQESADIWHSLAWRGVEDPLNDKFTEIAETVFRPIIKHRMILQAGLSDE